VRRSCGQQTPLCAKRKGVDAGRRRHLQDGFCRVGVFNGVPFGLAPNVQGRMTLPREALLLRHQVRAHHNRLSRSVGRMAGGGIGQFEKDELAGSAADYQLAGAPAEGYLLDCQARGVAVGIVVADLAGGRPLLLAIVVVASWKKITVENIMTVSMVSHVLAARLDRRRRRTCLSSPWPRE